MLFPGATIWLYMDIGFAKLDELDGDDLVFGQSIST